MTEQDAARVLQLRDHLWPHSRKPADTRGEVVLWASILADWTFEAVVAALRAERGREFPPTVGQVEALLDPRVDVPSLEAVLRDFAAVASRHGTQAGVPPVEAWSHPLVYSFAAAGWWAAWGTSPDAAYDPQGANTFRAQLRDLYAAHRADARRAVVRERVAIAERQRDALPEAIGQVLAELPQAAGS